MAEPLYVVCGATGHVGGVVAARLLDAKKRVRVVARSADSLKPLTARGAEAASGSIEDAGFVERAFQGAEAVFALVPPNFAVKGFRAWQNRVADALGAGLERARVRRAVTLSSIGADLAQGNGPIAGLHDMEERLNRVPGLAVLHLRPGSFMENTLTSIGMIKKMGINAGAIRADVRFPMIYTRDIGEVAARRLVALDFQESSFHELHGQRDLTMSEVTTALGKAIGKPDLQFTVLPYEEAKKAMAQMGLPEEMAGLYVEMSQGINDGLIRPRQPRSAATTTPARIETFAEQVFAPAYRAS
jgi:uncharacterized protein YbjT (DUF2867 family)